MYIRLRSRFKLDTVEVIREKFRLFRDLYDVINV